MKLEQLKSVDDALKYLDIDPKSIEVDFSSYPEQDRKSLGAITQIFPVVRAANKISNGGKEWTADFDNPNQPKYEIWWEKTPTGFRSRDCVDWYSFSNVGSRLCFVDRNTGKYVTTQFEALFNDYL